MFFLLVLINSCFWSGSLANYRHFHIENADVCESPDSENILSAIGRGSTPKKKLVIGSGAAIFSLNSPSSSFQPSYATSDVKRCVLHIKAPDENFGLVAYVEEMYMRVNSADGDCIDHIQFGQDDIIPYVTFSRSDKYCGHYNGKSRVSEGIVYDDPHGSLLIWISLGGRRQTPFWPSISAVNLTLVVTPYKKNCNKRDLNYKQCRESKKCVWSKYFCDGHFNCADDPHYPRDEDGCQAITSDPTSKDSGSGESEQEGSDNPNTLTVTLIIVCSALVILLTLILIVMKRRKSRPQQRSDCNNQDTTVRSIDELSHSRRPHEGNLYIPLNSFVSERNRGQLGNSDLVVTSVAHLEEPPPSYHELFPEDRQNGDGSENNVEDAQAEQDNNMVTSEERTV